MSAGTLAPLTRDPEPPPPQPPMLAKAAAKKARKYCAGFNCSPNYQLGFRSAPRHTRINSAIFSNAPCANTWRLYDALQISDLDLFNLLERKFLAGSVVKLSLPWRCV